MMFVSVLYANGAPVEQCYDARTGLRYAVVDQKAAGFEIKVQAPPLMQSRFMFQMTLDGATNPRHSAPSANGVSIQSRIAGQQPLSFSHEAGVIEICVSEAVASKNVSGAIGFNYIAGAPLAFLMVRYAQRGWLERHGILAHRRACYDLSLSKPLLKRRKTDPDMGLADLTITERAAIA